MGTFLNENDETGKNKPKNRRAFRKNKIKQICKKRTLFGANAAGISSKLQSFDYLLSTLQPSVFFIEETKMN